MTPAPHQSSGVEVKKPFLCRIRLHRWKFIAPALSGTGCAEQCSRCGLRRLFSFYGAYIYARED